MTPLGGLDALFLHLETPATPMHVGALHLLEAPPETPDLLAAIRRHVASRLPLSPVFTRRLRTVPLALANPVWIDVDRVDLLHHIRRIRLPRPGSQRQLEAAVARLHAQRLDRRKPLWQLFLIEGLANGDCALYSKFHHAAIDGAAGVALAQVLLDTTPVPRALPGLPSASRARRARTEPGDVRVIGQALAQGGRAGARLIGQLPALARTALGLLRGAGSGALAEWARHFSLAPATVFNHLIDARRSIATASLPLARVRAIATAQQTTLNDVVLALVGGALRRYLPAHGGLPAKPLLAAMPVSLREAGDTEMNTQATMTQASLATDIADPVARLQAIHAAAGAAKVLTRQLRPALDLPLPSLGLPWLLTAAAALYGRAGLAERLPSLANVVVSNVPGPPFALYIAAARLRTYWPLSIVEHGLGLNITVQRYGDSLDFGLVAARSAASDLDPLAQALHAALQELAAAAGVPGTVEHQLPRAGSRRPAAGRNAAGSVSATERKASPARKAVARSRPARKPRGGRSAAG